MRGRTLFIPKIIPLIKFFDYSYDFDLIIIFTLSLSHSRLLIKNYLLFIFLCLRAI